MPAPDSPAARLNRAAGWLVAAELVLLACVALCVRLAAPVGEIQTNGLSVYGTRARTVVPYAVGMLAISAACIAAGRYAERAGAGDGLALVLRAMGGLVIGILATPYSWGTLFNWTHMIFGGVLFFGQLALSGWLAIQLRSRLLWALFAIQLGGDLIAFASLPEIVDALLFGEVVSQLAFMPLLAVALRTLAQYHSTQTHTSPTRAQVAECGGSP